MKIYNPVPEFKGRFDDESISLFADLSSHVETLDEIVRRFKEELFNRFPDNNQKIDLGDIVIKTHKTRRTTTSYKSVWQDLTENYYNHVMDDASVGIHPVVVNGIPYVPISALIKRKEIIEERYRKTNIIRKITLDSIEVKSDFYEESLEKGELKIPEMWEITLSNLDARIFYTALRQSEEIKVLYIEPFIQAFKDITQPRSAKPARAKVKDERLEVIGKYIVSSRLPYADLIPELESLLRKILDKSDGLADGEKKRFWLDYGGRIYVSVFKQEEPLISLPSYKKLYERVIVHALNTRRERGKEKYHQLRSIKPEILK